MKWVKVTVVGTILVLLGLGVVEGKRVSARNRVRARTAFQGVITVFRVL